jgi:hypothetical protein
MSKAIIKSITTSFRRAGIEFSRAGREIDLNALTKDQVAAIYAEPNLQVTLLELPKKAAKNPEAPVVVPPPAGVPAAKPAAKPAKAKTTP